MIKFEGGSQPSKTNFVYSPKSGYVRIVQMRDFRTDNYKTYIPKKSTKKFFQKDDVMIGRYGPPNFQIFRGLEGAYNIALIKAIPKNNLEKDYLYYFLKQEKLFQIMDSMGDRTAGQDGVELVHLKKLPFHIPPIKERKKIVTILTNVDNTLEKTNQLIQKTELLKKGLMQKLFTQGIGHTKFKKVSFGLPFLTGKIPKQWKLCRIGEICESIVSGRNKPMKFDGEIPWLTITDLDEFYVEKSKNNLRVSKEELAEKGGKIIPPNSVLMSCVGDLGILAINKIEISMNQQLHAFICPDEILPSFLAQYLSTMKNYMYAIATKTTVPYMNKESCNSIVIVIPPLNEQKQIASILSNVDSQIIKEKLQKSNLELLKKGLMQKLLTGKVRVKL